MYVCMYVCIYIYTYIYILLEISFYTCVAKSTIIWGTASEIRSLAKSFCHFRPFFCPFFLTIIWYTSLDIWSAPDRTFLLSSATFLPFHPPNSLKNENLKKIKKTPVDIILHKCTKNHDHMIHCSRDMTCDGFNYFSFWAMFCRPPPLTAQKIKISKMKKEKKTPGDIITLHKCTENYD